jgi:hypothetical protein
MDTYGITVVLCDRCSERAAQQISNAKEWMTIELELGVKIWGPCGDCLDEWHSRTGQGVLSDIIEQIKAMRSTLLM